MNELQIFSNPAFGEIRVTDQNGEPWFVAADVCRALDIGNPTQAIARLDSDESTLISNEGREMNIISEPGLYALVLGSRKPEAKSFKRWVTHEVIPSIRRTGGYIAGAESMTPEELMAKALTVAQKTLADREARLSVLTVENQIMQPKAEYFDELVDRNLLTNFRETAKQLGVPPKKFVQFLLDKKYVYRDKRGKLMPYEDKNKGLFEILIPTATLVTAAITAWKVAQQAKTWLDVASKAVTAFTSANTASAAACGAATASVTLGQFAYGILTGNISLATAAQTIFNSVLNANPIGLVITAVTALGAGLVVLNNLLDTGQERAKRLDAAFASMGDGASKFQAGLETAQSRLSEFNAELFASSEEQADLQTNMQEVQNGITSICRLATEERRAYTEAEIIQLNEYFQRLDELSARQFEIEALRMDAISQQAVAEAEMHKGSLAEYQATAQQWIATAREQRDNQISLAQEQCTQKLALLAEEYKGSSVMTNQAYADEYNAAIKARDENIRVANEAVGGIVAAYTDGYAKRSGLVGLENQLTVTANQSLLSEQQRHVAEMQRIDDDYTLNEKQKQMKRSQETKLHEENMSKIWDDLTKNMTDEQKEQLGVYLDLVAQTELYGGQIEDATEQTAAGIVASFDNLPDDMRDAMSNALTPMLDEMERMEPVLYAKAESIANGILSRLRRAFQEKSPSRATRKIFRYVMQGGELGLDDEEPKLLNMAEDIGTSFISRMRDAVQTRRNLFSARFAAQGDYSAFRAQATQPALAGGTVTNLYQTINTHDSLSESELTREAENLLERSRWKNP